MDYVADAGQIAAFTHNVEEVVVDLPSGASSVGDNYAVNFNKYGTSFTPDFSGIDISRSGVSYVQHPYTRAMYPVRVVVPRPRERGKERYGGLSHPQCPARSLRICIQRRLQGNAGALLG